MDFIVQSPVTFCLLAITIYFSYKVMEDPYGKHKYMFEPYAIKHGKEYYRFLSHGLIHADWIHLLFNMYVLYSFGSLVEDVYGQLFGPILGPIFYLLLYLLGLIMSSMFSFFKYMNNPSYRALGASGAVSGIVFAFILFMPTQSMGLIFIPGVRIPAVIFGLLYMAYSVYMSQRGNDNIGHDAHYWGSVWGFAFTAMLQPKLILYFLDQITGYF